MPDVRSTSIRSIEWNPNDADDEALYGLVTVTFRRGNKREFELFDFPRSLYEEWLKAPSKGRFFEERVRGRF